MRFLYIGAFRFPIGDAAAARVLNNARLIQELGHDVRVLSFGGKKNDTWQDYDGVPYLVTSDIDTHSWHERICRYTRPYPHCRKAMSGLISEIDVVICYNLTFSFSKWLITFGRKYNKKIIVDVTEWYSAHEMPGGYWTPIYWMSEYFMKHKLRAIPNRILISTYLYNYYPYGNNVLLPPLVNICDEKWKFGFQDYPECVLKHQGLKVFYSGTPDNKDLLTELIYATLSILAESKRMQIIVAGVSEERALGFFPNKDDYFVNRQHFVFLGRIPQDLVPAYYRVADFSAIIRRPTRKNMAGFPTKMAESMAAGCPVIASDFSDITKYVCDGRNGIVLYDSSEHSIIEGLRRILALSPQDLTEMKREAKLCGERYFDYRNYKSIFREFINNLK